MRITIFTFSKLKLNPHYLKDKISFVTIVAIKQRIEEEDLYSKLNEFDIYIYRSFMREIQGQKSADQKFQNFAVRLSNVRIWRRIETNSTLICTSVCSRRSFMREWNRNRESCGVGRDYTRPTGTRHFRRSARVKLSWRMRGLEDSVAFNRPSRTCLSGLYCSLALSLFNAPGEHSFPFSTKFSPGKLAQLLIGRSFDA